MIAFRHLLPLLLNVAFIRGVVAIDYEKVIDWATDEAIDLIKEFAINFFKPIDQLDLTITPSSDSVHVLLVGSQPLRQKTMQLTVTTTQEDKRWKVITNIEFDKDERDNDVVSVTCTIQHKDDAAHPHHDDDEGFPISFTVTVTADHRDLTKANDNYVKKKKDANELAQLCKSHEATDPNDKDHKDCLTQGYMSITRQQREDGDNLIKSFKMEAKVIHGKTRKDAFAKDDPHFLTWGNHHFDYHGGCDLVLIHNPDFLNGLGLSVHIRTKVRYFYSYIRSAAVMIGDDIFEVDSYGEYRLNGVSGAAMPAEISGDLLINRTKAGTKDHEFVIPIDEILDEVITISTLKGLCFHQDQREWDAYLFGQEWQVREDEPMLFESTSEPTYPQECNMPDPAVRQAFRLRHGNVISQKEAEEACKHRGGAQGVKDCVFDVMATGDIENARAVSSF